MVTINQEDSVTEAAAAVQPDDDGPSFHLTVGAAMTEAQRVFDRLHGALGWRLTSEVDADRVSDKEVNVVATLAHCIGATVAVWQGSERDVSLILHMEEPMRVDLDGEGDR